MKILSFAIAALALVLPGSALAHTATLTGAATCVDAAGGFDIGWTLVLSNAAISAQASSTSNVALGSGIQVLDGGPLQYIFSGTLAGNTTHTASSSHSTSTPGVPPGSVTADGKIVWSNNFEQDVTTAVLFPAACPAATTTPPVTSTTTPSTPATTTPTTNSSGGGGGSSMTKKKCEAQGKQWVDVGSRYACRKIDTPAASPTATSTATTSASVATSLPLASLPATGFGWADLASYHRYHIALAFAFALAVTGIAFYVTARRRFGGLG